MIKLKIVNIDDRKYVLENVELNNQFEIKIDFFGLDDMPGIDDLLYIHKELLDQNYIEYSTHYQFGPLNEVYGRKINSIDDIDCIMLVINNKQIYLKRFFG